MLMNVSRDADALKRINDILKLIFFLSPTVQ